jgi:DNA-binding GntR family transcriptional regulator
VDDDGQERDVKPPRETLPPYRAVAAALRERVVNQEWIPGEQLPTVRELAAEYKVSISTVQKALRLLIDEGLVTVVGGWGIFRAS